MWARRLGGQDFVTELVGRHALASPWGHMAKCVFGSGREPLDLRLVIARS